MVAEERKIESDYYGIPRIALGEEYGGKRQDLKSSGPLEVAEISRDGECDGIIPHGFLGRQR